MPLHSVTDLASGFFLAADIDVAPGPLSIIFIYNNSGWG
jgi:hypothetical protein